jgi:hypothetical protein
MPCSGYAGDEVKTPTRSGAFLQSSIGFGISLSEPTLPAVRRFSFLFKTTSLGLCLETLVFDSEAMKFSPDMTELRHHSTPLTLLSLN